MFQRDYILRMIEQISRLMARILMLKSEEERQKGLVLLEQFYGKLMLPPVKLLLRMPDHELLSLVSVNGVPDMDKLAALAYLLKEEGRVHESLGNYAASSIRLNKSLFLFLHAARLGADVSGIDCGASIEELRELLRTYRIPGPTLSLLLHYYESCGQYAAGEDVLFELLESEPETAMGNVEEGGRFFDRILQLSDVSLEEGGLPRNEAEQGMRDMLRLFGAASI